MDQSKLKKLLQSLSPEEWKYLRWFVQSDYFNTDANLLRLYEALAKHYPAFEGRSLAKEVLYEKVFEGQPFNDGKWRNLVSKMVKLTEDYLVSIQWQNDPFLKEKILVEAFENRNIPYEAYKKKVLDTLDQIEALPFRDEVYFLLKTELQSKLYYQATASGQLDADAFLLHAMRGLDEFYTLARLKMMNEIAALKVSRPTLLKNVDYQSVAPDNPLFTIYQFAGELYAGKNEEVYRNAKNLFLEHIADIRSSEQKFVFKHLLAFAIRQIRADSAYLNEVFELYKLANENNLLTNKGMMTTATFVNVVTCAASLGDLEWTEQFMLQHQSKLEAGMRKEISDFGNGFLAFQKKDYARAIDYLSELDFKNVLFQCISKSLALQAYFEMFLQDDSYFQLVNSYSQSFEKYILRNLKTVEDKANSYLHFIRFVKHIATTIFRNEMNGSRAGELLKKLEETDFIAKRDWLNAKLHSLEKNKRG